MLRKASGGRCDGIRIFRILPTFVREGNEKTERAAHKKCETD
jgi:hypothetical protein